MLKFFSNGNRSGVFVGKFQEQRDVDWVGLDFLGTCKNSEASDKVITETDSKTGIATIYLNSAPVNSLDSEFLTANTLALKEVEKNPDVRGILLTSKFNGKVFCAGLNILDMHQRSHQQLFDYWTLVQEWYLTWHGCKKPTVAAINGHAPAGGCAWAMMCDHRVMQSDDGKTIGLNETQLGIVAPFFFVNLITSVVGHRMSESALLRGSLFSAQDALKYGMVDNIEPLENVLPKATAELKKLMSVPLSAYGLTKMLMRQKNINLLRASREEDAKTFASLVSQPHVQESITNYLKSLKARKK